MAHSISSNKRKFAAGALKSLSMLMRGNYKNKPITQTSKV